MGNLQPQQTKRNHTSDRLSALLIPILCALEEAWRGPIEPHLRPFHRMAHQGLGRLLEHEMERRP